MDDHATWPISFPQGLNLFTIRGMNHQVVWLKTLGCLVVHTKIVGTAGYPSHFIPLVHWSLDLAISCRHERLAVPSGKLTVCYGKSSSFFGVKQLFLWAMFQFANCFLVPFAENPKKHPSPNPAPFEPLDDLGVATCGDSMSRSM